MKQVFLAGFSEGQLENFSSGQCLCKQLGDLCSCMTSLGEAQELPSFLPSLPSLKSVSVHVFIYLLELSWQAEGV